MSPTRQCHFVVAGPPDICATNSDNVAAWASTVSSMMAITSARGTEYCAFFAFVTREHSSFSSGGTWNIPLLVLASILAVFTTCHATISFARCALDKLVHNRGALSSGLVVPLHVINLSRYQMDPTRASGRRKRNIVLPVHSPGNSLVSSGWGASGIQTP